MIATQSKDELAQEIERTAREAFGGGKLGDLLKRRGRWRAAATPTIKQTFADLGTHFKFRVAGRDCPGADPEWKYDLVWFVEDNDGFTTRVPLILESELDPNLSDPVDIDFVKLVDGRGEVRVWLSCAADPDGVERHIASCQRQAQLFSGTQPGDVYVFIIFDWATEGVTIRRFTTAEGS